MQTPQNPTVVFLTGDAGALTTVTVAPPVEATIPGHQPAGPTPAAEPPPTQLLIA